MRSDSTASGGGGTTGTFDMSILKAGPSLMSVGNDVDLAPVGRKRGKRRSWTRDEKHRIVEESLQQGASIAAARRHEVSAKLLFTWRRKMALKANEFLDVP